MANEDFKYPIELDHTKLNQLSDIQVELRTQLSAIAGQKAAINAMQDFIKQRTSELPRIKSGGTLVVAEYNSLLTITANDLNKRQQQLSEASATLEHVKTFLNDLLQ